MSFCIDLQIPLLDAILQLTEIFGVYFVGWNFIVMQMMTFQ